MEAQRNSITLRQDLIRKANEKPIRKCVQFDECMDDYTGEIDGFSSTQSYELKYLPFARVLIPQGRNAKQVIDFLKGVIQSLEEKPDSLNFEWGYPTVDSDWGSQRVSEDEYLLARTKSQPFAEHTGFPF